MAADLADASLILTLTADAALAVKAQQNGGVILGGHCGTDAGAPTYHFFQA